MSLRNGPSLDDDMISPWRSLRLRVRLTPKKKKSGGREEKLTEKTEKVLSSQKASFDWAIKIGRWLSTNGLKLFLQFRYNKTPVFALPPDWLPYYVEWILSFPRAPLGSVSVQVWSSVCAAAVRLVFETVTFVVTWVGGWIQQQKSGKTATPMAATKKAQ